MKVDVPKSTVEQALDAANEVADAINPKGDSQRKLLRGFYFIPGRMCGGLELSISGGRRSRKARRLLMRVTADAIVQEHGRYEQKRGRKKAVLWNTYELRTYFGVVAQFNDFYEAGTREWKMYLLLTSQVIPVLENMLRDDDSDTKAPQDNDVIPDQVPREWVDVHA